MSRIVYVSYPNGGLFGGQKMILRHVETLCDLGFDAIWWHADGNIPPTWFDFDAPTEVGVQFRPDDILVLPGDAPRALSHIATRDYRVVVFEQNQFTFAGLCYAAVDEFPPERLPAFIAVGETNAASLRRAYPTAQVEIVPCFADERIFRPGAERQDAIVAVPRKRPSEMRVIQAFFQRYHPRHAALPWRELDSVTEREVAATFRSSTLFLSLSRFESVGMTPLEAMACGCVCAGFTGVGGRVYATPENGFWVPDDDCEAAADALARAADLVHAGGSPLRDVQAAAYETARKWSYERFRIALEDVWSRLAPDARITSPAAPASRSLAAG